MPPPDVTSPLAHDAGPGPDAAWPLPQIAAGCPASVPVDAEKALLGALLIDNRAYNGVSEFLRPEHFAVGAHRALFAAVRGLIEDGRSADPVTLKAPLDADGTLDGLGGVGYLAELADSVISVINAPEYGRLIRDAALRRALIEVAEAVAARARDAGPDDDVPGIIAEAEQRLSAVAGTSFGPERSRDEIFDEAQHFIADRARNADRLPGLTTGFRALDDLTLGLQPKDLILLAARPSMGKTTLACALALTAARAGVPAHLITLEQPARQILLKLVANAAGVPLGQIQRGRYRNRPDALARVGETLAALKALPLHIDDTQGVTADAIAARARRLKRKHKTGLILIDQLLHIVTAPGRDSVNDKLGAVTRRLKALAKELGVPVVLLHQLNRGTEGREDKRPGLSDLRDTGHAEQDADVVLFLYREHYYLSRARPIRLRTESDEAHRTRTAAWERRCAACEPIADLIVAKNRMGPIGACQVGYWGALSRFAELGDAL